MKTIFVITHVTPIPPEAGDQIRILKLLEWLKGQGFFIVLILRTESLSEDVSKKLLEVVDRVYHLGDYAILHDGFIQKKLNKFHNLRMRFLLRVAKFSRSLTSQVIKENFCPRELKRLTRILSSQYSPFATIVEYPFLTPCFSSVPSKTLKIVDTIDMFSLKGQQVESYGIKQLFRCTPQEERKYLLKADVVIAIQSVEAQKLQALLPQREVITVGIHYDVPESQDHTLPASEFILMVGADNAPNIHGLSEFYKNAWPIIRQRNTKAVLKIVGKLGHHMSGRDSSIQVAGWVKNLGEEYKKASLVINPVIAGTGLKIKSVEALSYGKALVTWPNGVEGINTVGEPPFVICKSWKEFAETILRLMSSEEERSGLEQRAAAYSLENLKAEKVYAPLSKVLKTLKKPIVHVYTICWNEKIIAPYFLRHYLAFADQVVIYDNMSDDGSLDIIKSFPRTSIIPYDSGGQIRDDLYLKIKNNAWKKSRGVADWVIVVDMDELLYHENLFAFLEESQKKGVTIFVPSGFDMVSTGPPTKNGMIYDEIKDGVFNEVLCKPCLFNPNKIKEISYAVGGHTANPRGKVKFSRDGQLKLLHYKGLGFDYLLGKYTAYAKRLSAINLSNDWGSHYLQSETNLKEYFLSKRNLARKVVN